jgi:hypothetical protein
MQVSLGGLSPESNEEYSKSFFSYLEEKIGVTDDRGYMWVFAGCLPHWLILLPLQCVRRSWKGLHGVSVHPFHATKHLGH